MNFTKNNLPIEDLADNDLPVERFDEQEHQANDDYVPWSAGRDMSRNDAGEYSWM